MLNVLRAVHEPHIIKRTLGFAAFLLGSQNELVERTGGCGAASGAYCNKWILDEFCALCLGTHALVRDGMVRLMGFSFFCMMGRVSPLRVVEAVNGMARVATNFNNAEARLPI